MNADFFAWMDGFCSAFEDFEDGAWQAACENAVEVYNKEHGTKIDPFDGWIAWAQKRGVDMDNDVPEDGPPYDAATKTGMYDHDDTL